MVIEERSVFLRGIITGGGLRVESRVRATKRTLDDRVKYFHYSVMDSDLTYALPDGEYEVDVEETRVQIPVTKKNGCFQSRG